MTIDVCENINAIINELEDFVKNPDLFIDNEFLSIFDKLKSFILRMYILSNFKEGKGEYLRQKIQNNITELFSLVEDYDFKKDYQKEELLIQRHNLSPHIENLSKIF